MHNGKQLSEDASLEAAGVSNGATISVCSRLRGGGGDGGSTGAESRSCYLEMYASRKPDKVGVCLWAVLCGCAVRDAANIVTGGIGSMGLAHQGRACSNWLSSGSVYAADKQCVSVVNMPVVPWTVAPKGVMLPCNLYPPGHKAASTAPNACWRPC